MSLTALIDNPYGNQLLSESDTYKWNSTSTEIHSPPRREGGNDYSQSPSISDSDDASFRGKNNTSDDDDFTIESESDGVRPPTRRSKYSRRQSRSSKQLDIDQNETKGKHSTRRSNRATQNKKNMQEIVNSDSESDESEEDNDSDESKPSKIKKRTVQARTRRTRVADSDEDYEDEGANAHRRVGRWLNILTLH
jgi:hypothetical protein